MSKKRVILSDSSLNRYGYRILTEGLDIDAFKKNPIIFYMHFRDNGSPIWGDHKAIGHWEDIQLNGDELSAVPVFDKVDDESKIVAAKFEAGTYSAASIGVKIIATSEEKKYLLPGQTRATVIKAELWEASIVDIPANANCVRLFDRSTAALLAVGMDLLEVPELSSHNKSNTMNLKSQWKTVLQFLKIGEDKADTTELSADNLEAINTEMARLKSENDTLTQDKKNADDKLTASQSEVETLKTGAAAKDAEISTLKSSVATKDAEIAQLKEQVANLKNQPTGGGNVTPRTEPEATEGDSLAEFCKTEHSHAEMAAYLKKEGLI
jgi:hypothetical protein